MPSLSIFDLSEMWTDDPKCGLSVPNIDRFVHTKYGQVATLIAIKHEDVYGLSITIFRFDRGPF